jgi:hypothetical protein
MMLCYSAILATFYRKTTVKDLSSLFKIKHHCLFRKSQLGEDRAEGAWTEGKKKHIDNLIVENLKKNNLCQVMKLLIAIHVSF